MDPTEAIRTIETALRNAIHQVMPNGEWLSAKKPPKRAVLEERRNEERKKRDGALTSDDLLSYANTHDFTELIIANWEKFKPIFDDSARTKVYFGILNDVRNTVMHSRELLHFERDLLSGIAGQLRNQVAMYRNSDNPSRTYYPTIDSLTDSFGTVPVAGISPLGLRVSTRLNVGDQIQFTGFATLARGKDVEWFLQRQPTMGQLGRVTTIGRGESLDYTYVVTEKDVRESLEIVIGIHSDSKYHRNGNHDDVRSFAYTVNPPLDE